MFEGDYDDTGSVLHPALDLTYYSLTSLYAWGLRWFSPQTCYWHLPVALTLIAQKKGLGLYILACKWETNYTRPKV